MIVLAYLTTIDFDDWKKMSNVTTSIENETKPFKGIIAVSSSIIDQLSSGLYENPAACLKELINNAYDADATEVTMSIRPDADIIIIEDNGTGFSRVDFERHFKRIARSYKREQSDTTSKGRLKIGKIGIGFIAANEICEKLEIVSTVAGSNELMTVLLDFEKMRQDPSTRIHEDESLEKGDYYGNTSYDANVDEHFTRLYLQEIREGAREVLNGARLGKNDLSLYGLTDTSVLDKLQNPSFKSWSELDQYSQALLEIALNVPVAYHEGWYGDANRNSFALFDQRISDLDFSLTIDGARQKKPIVFYNPDGKTLSYAFEIKGELVTASGYFIAYDHKLAPSDINGLLIRVRNSAVGKYDQTYLGYPGWKDALFQDWASVELYVDDSFEEVINIDRRTLRTTHPAYLELQRLLHEQLTSFFASVRKELYGERSKERKVIKAQKEVNDLVEAFSAELTPTLKKPVVPVQTLEDFANSMNRNKLDSKQVKKLTKAYRPAQVVSLVRRAAFEAGLSEDQIESLLIQVGKELQR
jgi:hypothetical protein